MMTNDSSQLDRLEAMESRLIQLQLDSLAQNIKDHEVRLRVLEETATKFNFLLYLTMGGGLISLFNLLAILIVVVEATRGKL